MTYPPQPNYAPYPPAMPPRRSRRKLWWILGGIGGAVFSCLAGLIVIGLIVGPTQKPQTTTGQVALDAPVATDEPAAQAPTPSTPAAAVPTATVAPSPTTPPAPPKPTTVKMPNLVDLNAAVAIDKLERLGWTRDQIDLGSQDEQDTWVILPQNWTVTKQSERAGAKVEPGSLIVLTCTKQH
jgi:PASTA domain